MAKEKAKKPAASKNAAPKTTASKAEDKSQGAGQQPLFYSEPVPILQDRHKEAGITNDDNFSFTSETNSVPINLAEFGEVAKTYPIVFSVGPKPIPLCVLGVEAKQNLFVNKKGEWDENNYIPAYVRRYPFAFSETGNKDDDKLILCIDEGSDRFVEKAKKKDLAFFDKDVKQTGLIDFALKFCTQYHSDQAETVTVCELLSERKLLKERQITIDGINGGKPTQLSGFQTIDEEAFRNIPADILQQWHQMGYLGIMYYHFLSQSNWNNLAKKLS